MVGFGSVVWMVTVMPSAVMVIDHQVAPGPVMDSTKCSRHSFTAWPSKARPLVKVTPSVG